ncbi:MAG: EAL domain-containing protein [Acidimicrobiales bacterium]
MTHGESHALTREPTTLSPSEELGFLRHVFLHLPDGIVIVDGAGEIVWGNRSAERMFERSLADWKGQSGLDLVHPDDQEFVLRSLTSVQDKDVGTPIEIRINAASGWRLVEIVGTTVRWSGENVVLLCLRDLTERRRFELASGREARFRSLVHNAGSVIMLVSSEGILESVSGAITRLLGHDPELLEQRPLVNIVAEDDRAEFAAALDEARRGTAAGHPVTARVGLVRHDGAATVPFELSIVNLLDDPTVEGLVISAHDATAQVSAETELGKALSLLTATLDSTADGILVVDAAGKVTSVNRRFGEIWHLPDDLLATKDDQQALAFVLDQMAHPDAFVAKVEELYAQPETESFDTLEFKDGRVVERHSRPQRVDGKTVGRVWSFRDVTDHKRLEEELAYRAFHDSLTGLANKALFQDRLDHALARIERTKSHLAVLFLDLDDFKTVNDSLGHGEGDHLLRRVATTLVGCLGASDTAARLGGDEFAVLIEDVQSQNAITALAQRILDTLRPPVRLGTKSVSSAVSIGIAFNEAGTTSEQLLRNADIAMYKAKALGKDRFEIYRDEMYASVLARLELEEELRAAIDAGDLAVHYQPIIDLDAHRVVGLEALVRWSHPTRGLVPPAVFVPLAEELGLIGEIDSFVLRSACRQAREWRDEHLGSPELTMSVNLSARQLTEPFLSDRIAAQIDECGFDPRSLILEITESAMLTDNDATVHNLAQLRALGVRIALDDFGTGYSSFSHLDRLQIDIVKIDKSFVQALGSPDDTRGLAAAIVQLARTLGYQAIAEGVEQAEQADSLRALGCGLAQGYHLGRPLDATATGLLLGSYDSLVPMLERRRSA